MKNILPWICIFCHRHSKQYSKCLFVSRSSFT